MKPELLNFLRCPACKSKLSLIIRSSEGKEIKEGLLECFCQKKYKISNFIPRRTATMRHRSDSRFMKDSSPEAILIALLDPVP